MARLAPPLDTPAAPDRGEPPAGGEPHPLAGSVATIDAAVDWMRFELGPLSAPGWWPCDRVLTDDVLLSAWRVALHARLARRHGHAPRRVPAAYVLQWYLGVSTWPGALLFHRDRRVPDLDPAALALRTDAGHLAAIRLRPGPFCCLPGDPAAGHADARVVVDEAALAATLRRRVVAHAARFLEIYGPSVPFGPRTLWGAVTDVLDTGLLLAGRAAGDEAAGVTDARLVLDRRHEPLRSASTIRTVTDQQGRTHWTRQRSSCCLYYALPAAPRPCTTCPRLSDPERARILGRQD